MKIFYWSPFFTNIATISAVIKSANSLKLYSNKKIDVSLIDAIGEWDKYSNKIDKNIDEKFNDWAPIFMSLLVDISFKNKGNVNDCPIVMSASDQYREGQDFITQFVKEMVIKSKGDKIKKTELSEQFKIWWAENQGRGGQPKNSELNDFMTIRYGTYRNGWQNVAINYDNDDDEDIPSFN